jgi:ACR3 family arsenite efflux pump ArsB
VIIPPAVLITSVVVFIVIPLVAGFIRHFVIKGKRRRVV